MSQAEYPFRGRPSSGGPMAPVCALSSGKTYGIVRQKCAGRFGLVRVVTVARVRESRTFDGWIPWRTRWPTFARSGIGAGRRKFWAGSHCLANPLTVSQTTSCGAFNRTASASLQIDLGNGLSHQESELPHSGA